MGSNNDGFSGVEIEHVGLEKNILVGVQAPNITPCLKIDETGKSLPKFNFSDKIGMEANPHQGFDCKYADTSWLSHGGIFSVTAGNKMNFTTGSGGFELTTCGPTKFNTVFADFWATHAFNVNTRLFTVATSQRTHLMGTRIDFDYDETYFNGNITFINNVAMNGSLYVNGEIYCRHMTGIGQRNQTSPSPDLTGFINPEQSFVIFSGASTVARAMQPAIDCTIQMPFPDPIGKTLTVPCKITFMNGISLASDSTISDAPEAQTLIAQGSNRVANPQSSDITGPGHIHEFVGPPFQPSGGSTEFFKEVKTAMESKTPTQAKKVQPNGCSSLEEFTSQCEEALTNTIKGYLVRLKGYIFGMFSNLFSGNGN